MFPGWPIPAGNVTILRLVKPHPIIGNPRLQPTSCSSKKPVLFCIVNYSPDSARRLSLNRLRLAKPSIALPC
jgi:hypothetical protein